MAESEGFEPPIALRLWLISSQLHSTGLCQLSALVSRSVQTAFEITRPVYVLYQSTMPQNARQTFGLISSSKVRHIHTIQCLTFL
jgi:hypothetical protein